MVKRVCIVCEKEVKDNDFVRVKDDVIITTIRKVKTLLRIVKNNELVVHQECEQEARKRRTQFERRLLFSVLFSAFIVVSFNVLPLLAGKFSLNVLLSSLVLAVFPPIIVILTSYFPALERRSDDEEQSKA